VEENTMTVRNAPLPSLIEMLQQEHAMKVDLPVTAGNIRIDQQGQLVVRGAEIVVDENGVTDPNGVYTCSDVFDDGLRDKLGIPRAYLRRMRTDAPDILAANVNGWLHGRTVRKPGQDAEVVRAGTDKRYLVRLFAGQDGPGVARALLSDRYGLIDNLDVAMAALQGIRDAGVDVDGDDISGDLTDRKMYLKVRVPQIGVLAPTLLDGYRSPFRDAGVEEQRNHGWNLERARNAAQAEGMTPEQEQLVYAGLEVRNSEVGDGAFTIVPVLTINVCRNGLNVTAEALRRVHIGSKLDDGMIQWSSDTVTKSRDLIVAKTRDAVKSFLNAEFVQSIVDRITAQAVVELDKPQETVEAISKQLAFTESESRGILDHFMRGGQMTAGGVMQAVTSFSQTLGDAERAHALDDAALQVLELAAK
jgi:hypothetical protein